MSKKDNSLWLWVGIGVALAALSGTAAVEVYGMTRGLRNNNPGNIVNNPANPWVGQVGVDSVAPCPPGGFCVFDSMADGLRAIMVTLNTYWTKYGLNTVSGIISRWSTTDQAAYQADVASSLGVGVNDTLDMTNPATYIALSQAITFQENGLDPLAMTDLQLAVNNAGIGQGSTTNLASVISTALPDLSTLPDLSASLDTTDNS